MINEDVFKKFEDINKGGYGSACLEVARNVLAYLDKFEGEFNIGYHPDLTTPHGIICECDNQGGITGFQSSAVVTIVTHCYERGWQFYIADKLNRFNYKDVPVREKLKNTLVENNLATEDQVEKYIVELVERFESNQDKKEK